MGSLPWQSTQLSTDTELIATPFSTWTCFSELRSLTVKWKAVVIRSHPTTPVNGAGTGAGMEDGGGMKDRSGIEDRAGTGLQYRLSLLLHSLLLLSLLLLSFLLLSQGLSCCYLCCFIYHLDKFQSKAAQIKIGHLPYLVLLGLSRTAAGYPRDSQGAQEKSDEVSGSQESLSLLMPDIAEPRMSQNQEENQTLMWACAQRH